MSKAFLGHIKVEYSIIIWRISNDMSEWFLILGKTAIQGKNIMLKNQAGSRVRITFWMDMVDNPDMDRLHHRGLPWLWAKDLTCIEEVLGGSGCTEGLSMNGRMIDYTMMGCREGSTLDMFLENSILQFMGSQNLQIMGCKRLLRNFDSSPKE